MPDRTPNHVAYKLDGDALEAAKALIALERQMIESRTGGKVPAGTRANLLRRDVMDEIQRQRPDLVEKLQLAKGAVRIEREEGGHPRAYEEFPYVADCQTADDTHYFLFCPVDYKGNHTVPAGGERVPEDDLYPTDFGELVYQRKGYIGLPFAYNQKRGTAMPADFDPAEDNYRATGIAGRRYKVFIAGGASLSCVQDFVRRRDELRQAREDVKKALEGLAPALAGTSLGAAGDDRLKGSVSFSTDKNGRTEVWLRLVNESRNGEAVALRDNEHFTADDFRGGAFRIRPNSETEAGRKLGRVFDKLLSEPDLGQYWQIHNPTASGVKDSFNGNAGPGNRVPKLDTVRGVHYLVYLLDNEAEKDHCNPPGGIPVNLAEYLWLKADMRDEEAFIRPADPPEALSHMRPIKPAPKP